MAKGHYRTSRVSKFQELAQAGVSANGKLLYFYFALGPFSSFAGIGRVSVDTTASDTGLSRAEIESALAELEKKPTPARSFILYDLERRIVWVRDYLKDDPAREKDPDILNETHRKGIENTLGDLPRDSPAVRKFRSYYNFPRHTPTRGPAGGTGGGVEVPTAYTENNKQLPTSDRARAREDKASPTARPLGGAPSPPSTNNGQAGKEYRVTKADSDKRRAHWRDRYIAEGEPRNRADTLAGHTVADEMNYRGQHGHWPGETPSLGALEQQIRAERPDLSQERVTYWALMRETDVKAGLPLRPITTPIEVRP